MKMIEMQREKWKKILPTQTILDLEIPENLDDWELIENFGNENPGVKFVAIHRFELFGEKFKTLKEIAEIVRLKSGREQIRLYEAKAIRILRHPYRKHLYPFIRNKRLFNLITGYRNIMEYIMFNHFNYEEYLKITQTNSSDIPKLLGPK